MYIAMHSIYYSNTTTWQAHNALLLTRLSLKHILENLSEMEAILQLDGAKTVQQITSLESATSPPPPLRPPEPPDSASVDGIRSRTESGGIRSQESGDQTVSSSLTSISNPDLDSLANQTVGSAEREATAGNSLSEGGVKFENAMNPEEIFAMKTLLSKQLVDSLVSLIAEIPLL